MSKALIGDHFWAEMAEGQKIEAVLKGQATLTQMSEGLLYGSQKLRTACEEFLAHTGASFDDLHVEIYETNASERPATNNNKDLPRRRLKSAKKAISVSTVKHRFGLPKGFVHRVQRNERSVLLEKNVYRLPNGQEFIPCLPTGTLGGCHLYALLTVEQYLKGKRGSVYVRTDGRVFDYSVDNGVPLGDLFDTGYTTQDLERTGRYAPMPRRRKRKNQPTRVRRAAAG